MAARCSLVTSQQWSIRAASVIAFMTCAVRPQVPPLSGPGWSIGNARPAMTRLPDTLRSTVGVDFVLDDTRPGTAGATRDRNEFRIRYGRPGAIVTDGHGNLERAAVDRRDLPLGQQDGSAEYAVAAVAEIRDVRP